MIRKSEVRRERSIGLYGGAFRRTHMVATTRQPLLTHWFNEGDWWDLRTYYGLRESASHRDAGAASHRGHNNLDDALRHAEWSCRMTREIDRLRRTRLVWRTRSMGGLLVSLGAKV